MDPTMIPIALEIVKGVKAGIAWLVAQRGGSNADALAIIEQWQGARDKSIFGEDISDILSMTASGLSWLTSRKMTNADVVALLEAADAEGRDLTDEEVLSFFDDTDEIAERVDDAIAELEAEEAAEGGEGEGEEGGEGEPGEPEQPE